MSQDLHDGIVAFEPLSTGRERIVLGRVEVGEIAPTDHPSSRHPTCFRLTLPSVSSRPWHPARSIEDARRQAVAKIGDWIDAAGLCPTATKQTGSTNLCKSCGRMFVDGETCRFGGCPMGGDF